MLAKAVYSNKSILTRLPARHVIHHGLTTHWELVPVKNTHIEKHGRLEDHDDTTYKRGTKYRRNSMQVV